jgi:hypothetical protein
VPAVSLLLVIALALHDFLQRAICQLHSWAVALWHESGYYRAAFVAGYVIYASSWHCAPAGVELGELNWDARITGCRMLRVAAPEEGEESTPEDGATPASKLVQIYVVAADSAGWSTRSARRLCPTLRAPWPLGARLRNCVRVRLRARCLLRMAALGKG